MYRIYESKLQSWIDYSKKALLIYGARQVGKTFLIREMLKRNHISFCEYNLVERGDILDYLREENNAAEISSQLALFSDVALTEKESVIFLDEIQCYPDIVTKIKFLVDEGRYRFILSGSNLGVELKGIKSIPIGYVESWQMVPMNFEEFVLASGISASAVSHIKECYIDKRPVADIIHKKMIQAFYYYLVVGGMPAVVNTFNESHSLDRIQTEQTNILNQYRLDFTRYEVDHKRLRVRAIYDNIPTQLDKQNRKFTYTLLDKELKFNRYEESFLWLKDAAVAIPAYIVSEPKSPLMMSKETNVFKLYLSDVGLLTGSYPVSVRHDLLAMNPDQIINNGALFENFVAQEFYTTQPSIYYYKKKNLGEVDFILETQGKIIPVEVKSGKNYKKHAALNRLLEAYSFETACVLSLNNVEQSDGIVYLPIYMAGLIPTETDSTYPDQIPAL